jgi:ubiquinone/menaquinone biosynthesis C-methylase UbiE
MGAGSGRSTLMVLQGRPRATVIALDLYHGNFGIPDNTPDRLRANARIAGVIDRVETQPGDMRRMPFPDGSFDAAVSAYAIDHLGREGETQALAEARRILRPGGQFLLMVVNIDCWIRVAFPVPHGHGYFSSRQDPARWRHALSAAGLDVEEEGRTPGTLFFLARKGD